MLNWNFSGGDFSSVELMGTTNPESGIREKSRKSSTLYSCEPWVCSIAFKAAGGTGGWGESMGRAFRQWGGMYLFRGEGTSFFI
jgi:hypothetical protein